MENYDPEQAPDATQWLDMDEQDRIQLVADHHRRIRVKLPNLKIHAAIHAVVENQLAEELQTVQTTLKRLMDAGLSRHDAIHAIGTALVDHMSKLARKEVTAADPVQAYFETLRGLSAESWQKDFGRPR